MVEYGVVITFATITLLVAEYSSRRRAPYPAYGWLGIACLAGAEWLMFRGIEPVATFFTPVAWSAYILIVDAAVFSVTGRSRLRTAPLALLRMAALSIPLWLIFEAYNLRLRNWTYDGVPDFWPAGMIGYAWSFATITPAIFETADLIQAFLPFRERESHKDFAWRANGIDDCGSGVPCGSAGVAAAHRGLSFCAGVDWVSFAA